MLSVAPPLPHPANKRGVRFESKNACLSRCVFVFLQATVPKTLEEQHWPMLAPSESDTSPMTSDLLKWHQKTRNAVVEIPTAFLSVRLCLSGTTFCGSTASLLWSTSSSRCCAWPTTLHGWSTERTSGFVHTHFQAVSFPAVPWRVHMC